MFLDAYPKPVSVNKSGSLSVDIANNIWSWKNNNLNYKPNPQTFLSLKQSTFVIGIRPTSSCSSEILEKVKEWFIAGLQSGIGSQVNTGYGRLVSHNSTEYQYFFQVPFTIQGQLIHGKQKFVNLPQPYKRDKNNNLKPNTSAPQERLNAINKSFTNLTWMMFHLGGVGQGARRPCYSRQGRYPKANTPKWRGSTLLMPKSNDNFWKLPETVTEFTTKYYVVNLKIHLL